MLKNGLSKYVPWGTAKGFTLVELVTVIVLLGILSVYVAPRIFDLGIFKERGFFDETQSALRYAQKLAVGSGCAVQVSLTSSGYTLNQATVCNGAIFTLAVPHPSSSANFTATAPTGVVLAPAPTTLVFNALGQISAGIAGDSRDITVGTQTLRLWRESGYVERL